MDLGERSVSFGGLHSMDLGSRSVSHGGLYCMDLGTRSVSSGGLWRMVLGVFQGTGCTGKVWSGDFFNCVYP